MPRNVRNFWIDLSVDGRKATVETGPRRRDGGFSARIFIRDKGDVRMAAIITGKVRGKDLALKIEPLMQWDGSIAITTER